MENQAADILTLEHYLVEEERLTEPFEISDGVVIPGGTFQLRPRLRNSIPPESSACCPPISTVCNGDFYDGTIFIFETRTVWRPSAHLKVGVGGEYNDVDLPQGDFITRLMTLNVDVAFNTAWSWENFFQYDNVSDTVGVNSILRWIPRAGRETVLAINSQMEDFDRDGRFHSYTSDLTFKLSYTFRF